MQEEKKFNGNLNKSILAILMTMAIVSGVFNILPAVFTAKKIDDSEVVKKDNMTLSELMIYTEAKYELKGNNLYITIPKEVSEYLKENKGEKLRESKIGNLEYNNDGTITLIIWDSNRRGL